MADYVIIVDDEVWASPVDAPELAYVHAEIDPALRDLSDEDYLTGVAAIRHTAAPAGLLLVDDRVLTCVEWQPGLLVIESTPGPTLRRAVLESPAPGFGGVPVDAGALAAYHADPTRQARREHQYNLVFTPWDAALDLDGRDGWSPITDDARSRFTAATAHLDALNARVTALTSDPADYERWITASQATPIWNGEIR
ncbi:hypothetical protein FHS29_006184 [Saccharothrix tamanrassetensis]|uniref:Uncharacterized protein n=1 Tax=Saccharothrix tamanrassetensis TaxID=1051531 RepID=A0A841CRR3_9PSEU|nr:hypothetical protein [Saccharothrix tamanrassetensis]MBB5959563.1 hypothetical protein [Saccharothrix tamanrassetensis]